MSTAIIVIDFINDIVAKDGKIPTCAAHVAERGAISKANLALNLARKYHWLIFQVKVGFTEQYLEQPKNSPIFGKAQQFQALTLGKWGTEFHADLNIHKNDYIITKHRISPFYGTDLSMVLKNNRIERLVICGVSSTWAIQAAVRDAHDRDYEILVLEDACGAANENEHQISMQQLSRIAKIIKTSDLQMLIESGAF